MKVDASYIGRFAPSPSGPLHFGSLVTALGSFLQAKSQNGQWLLRIEDIDPPREVKGASDAIMRCLEAHHLFWDGEVVYQSNRSQLYEEKIKLLGERGLTYYCVCTRAQLTRLAPGKLCDCAKHNSHPDSVNSDTSNTSIRFKYDRVHEHFSDGVLGQVSLPEDNIASQFAIRRKDGLFAYQLAVVVDDIEQGITEVARGADLLDATFFQLALFRAFERPAPKYLHFPVVLAEPGKKLSKQNHACAVNTDDVCTNLIYALEFLGLSSLQELRQEPVQNILTWAIEQWHVSKVPVKTACIDNRIGQADSI